MTEPPADTGSPADAEQLPPGELLVAQRVERTQDPFARRVHRDGAVYEYTSVVARFEDGEWHFETQPLAWRPVVTLPAEAVEALEALIRREGILDLPPEHLPSGTVIGGSDVTWTVELDGRCNTVRLLGVGADQPAPFAALDQAVQLAVAQALDQQSAGGA